MQGPLSPTLTLIAVYSLRSRAAVGLGVWRAMDDHQLRPGEGVGGPGEGSAPK